MSIKPEGVEGKSYKDKTKVVSQGLTRATSPSPDVCEVGVVREQQAMWVPTAQDPAPGAWGVPEAMASVVELHRLHRGGGGVEAWHGERVFLAGEAGGVRAPVHVLGGAMERLRKGASNHAHHLTITNMYTSTFTQVLYCTVLLLH